jgi:hypothetical protein
MRFVEFIKTGLLSLILCGAGCSAFNYEWRQAMKKPVPARDITGPWEGHWKSDVTGHNNALRALITSADTNHYDVKFHAAYKSETFPFITVHFGYTVRMESRPGTNGLAFQGLEDLGTMAGGVYTYDGQANPTQFLCTYRSKYDHGIFDMHRPGPK